MILWENLLLIIKKMKLINVIRWKVNFEQDNAFEKSILQAQNYIRVNGLTKIGPLI